MGYRTARIIKTLGGALLIAALCVSAWADMSGSSAPAAGISSDDGWLKAKELIKAAKYQDALPLLENLASAHPNSADVYNSMGFAERHLKHFDKALVYYRRALELDPKHRGAHEYLGELYLMMDQPAKADEHLKILDKLCTFGCEEYSDLKKAIQAHKAKR